jgi:hypothetical protein
VPASMASLLSPDTEVICIVRSKTNPGQSGQVVVFDRPPRDLLHCLATRMGSPQRAVPTVVQASGQSPAVASRSPRDTAPGESRGATARAQSLR